MRPEIKEGIRYQEIRRFSVLVNKCRIYNEDNKAQYAHYKSLSKKKENGHNHGKPYGYLVDKGNQKGYYKVASGKEKSEGRNPAYVRFFKCREFEHRISECKRTTVNFFKCGKLDHQVAKYKSNSLTCYNYGEQGHISTQCEKPKITQYGGKVFALSKIETIASDRYMFY